MTWKALIYKVVLLLVVGSLLGVAVCVAAFVVTVMVTLR
jgi:hypothetical protein